MSQQRPLSLVRLAYKFVRTLGPAMSALSNVGDQRLPARNPISRRPLATAPRRKLAAGNTSWLYAQKNAGRCTLLLRTQAFAQAIGCLLFRLGLRAPSAKSVDSGHFTVGSRLGGPQFGGFGVIAQRV